MAQLCAPGFDCALLVSFLCSNRFVHDDPLKSMLNTTVHRILVLPTMLRVHLVTFAHRTKGFLIKRGWTISMPL